MASSGFLQCVSADDVAEQADGEIGAVQQPREGHWRVKGHVLHIAARGRDKENAPVSPSVMAATSASARTGTSDHSDPSGHQHCTGCWRWNIAVGG